MSKQQILSKAYAEAHSGPASDKVYKGATILSYLLIFFMLGILSIHVSAFKGWLTHNKLIPNPHYGAGLEHGIDYEGKDRKCLYCHDYPRDLCESHDQHECMECHEEDGLAKRLTSRSVLIVCTACHAPIQMYISYEHNGARKEVDVVRHHPYGLAMTPSTYPMTLPLRDGLAMTCLTCHDIHDPDEGNNMLRIFDETKQFPDNIKPLCHDCHHSNGVL